MTIFTVGQGKRYRAVISLGFLERFASNETMANKLRAAGFSEVHVSGSRAARIAEALWSSAERLQRCLLKSPQWPRCQVDHRPFSAVHLADASIAGGSDTSAPHEFLNKAQASAFLPPANFRRTP